MSETKPAKVPSTRKVPSYCKPHEWLLLASYCGGENPECSERRPCYDCIRMSNVFGEDGTYLRQFYQPRAARPRARGEKEGG